MKVYDLIVIGGGSGGLATARKAVTFNKKVLLIEKSMLGGTCVHLGCVPKKVSYNLANLLDSKALWKGYSIKNESDLKLNFEKFVEKRDAYIKRLENNFKNLVNKEKIDYIEGYAHVHKDFVTVGDQNFKFEKCILATGSKAKTYKAKITFDSNLGEIDLNNIIKYSDDFFYLKKIPKKCVIIGSGYIAIELGFTLKSFGSEVHLIARNDSLLSHFDNVLGEKVHQSMIKKGIKVYFNSTIDSIKVKSKNDANEYCSDFVIKQNINNDQECEYKTCNDVDFIMAAIGRDCDLNYIKTEMENKNGFIKVDNNFKTSNENIYAIGDLIGEKYMLTPFAIYCGRLLCDHLYANVDLSTKNMFECVPSVVFSHPPCASVGLSEKEVEKMKNVVVYKSNFINMFYCFEEEKEVSTYKVITVNGKVVGIHLFGTGSDEIIQGFAVAMKIGCSYEDLRNTVGVHPSASEELVTIK